MDVILPQKIPWTNTALVTTQIKRMPAPNVLSQPSTLTILQTIKSLITFKGKRGEVIFIPKIYTVYFFETFCIKTVFISI